MSQLPLRQRQTTMTRPVAQTSDIPNDPSYESVLHASSFPGKDPRLAITDAFAMTSNIQARLRHINDTVRDRPVSPREDPTDRHLNHETQESQLDLNRKLNDMHQKLARKNATIYRLRQERQAQATEIQDTRNRLCTMLDIFSQGDEHSLDELCTAIQGRFGELIKRQMELIAALEDETTRKEDMIRKKAKENDIEGVEEMLVNVAKQGGKAVRDV